MLVTGGSGYLGDWVVRLAASEWDVTATYATKPGRNENSHWSRLDVRDAEAVDNLVDEVRPQVLVHTAALNPGQGADFEGVNVAGTANIAASCARTGTRLIHVSTDIVFDGQRGGYREDDEPNPLNEYGRTKHLAEQAIAASGASAAIVRTSLIYGWRPTVARAAQWMIDAIGRGETINLWADEMRNPIWVESLASALVELAATDYTGFLHVAGEQPMSRYDFGVALLNFHGVGLDSVNAIPSPTDTQRPLNCTMDTSLARELLNTRLPGVDEVLSTAE